MVQSTVFRSVKSGDLIFDGTVSHQEIQISGSGDYNARTLQSETTAVRINGSGDVTLNVKNQLDIQVSGSGDVRYEGNPQLNSRIRGSGNITKL